MPEDGYSRELRDDLPKQFKTLAGGVSGAEGKAGDVGTWTGQARHKPHADWIVCSDEDDRYGGGDFLGRYHSRRARRDQDVDLESHEVICEMRKLIKASIREAVLEDQVSALDVPELSQPLDKRVDPFLGRLAGPQEPDL